MMMTLDPRLKRGDRAINYRKGKTNQNREAMVKLGIANDYTHTRYVLILQEMTICLRCSIIQCKKAGLFSHLK